MGEHDPLLQVRNLAVRYRVPRGLVRTLARKPRDYVHAVDDISLVLDRGEMLALVGESGCGKTTTAHAILRLVNADSGLIRLGGRDITKLSQRELRPLRRRAQIIYQDPYESLDPRFRVRRIVEESLLVHRREFSGVDRRMKISKALVQVGLDPPDLFMERYPHELSGGQRQRVAIAAALVLEPELLIADEPVSMLDVSVRAGILSLLHDLRRQGLAILMITHDISTAAHFADRIAVLYLGRIVEEGPAADVVNRPQHPYTKALMSVVPDPDPLRQQPFQVLRGETPNPVRVPPGCRFHPRCPVAQEVCRSEDPALHLAKDAGSPTHTDACLFA